MIYNNTKTLVESLMNDKIPTSKICLDMTFGNCLLYTSPSPRD